MHVSGTYLDTTQSFDCILFASWRLQRQQVLHILSFAKRNAASGQNRKLYTNSYLWRTALTCMSWCKHVYRSLKLSTNRFGHFSRTCVKIGLQFLALMALSRRSSPYRHLQNFGTFHVRVSRHKASPYLTGHCSGYLKWQCRDTYRISTLFT